MEEIGGGGGAQRTACRAGGSEGQSGAEVGEERGAMAGEGVGER